ncbi:unnamed protein product [Microthlaspi erraticum]|uniref:Uncharacterized protein n=1 Tax=Microthlaspi erraticum TaxID=1685480 RepID=A0A6D2LEK9_9BRAS|nr:unnamed protein product [Microthlaspi erraticum]
MNDPNLNHRQVASHLQKYKSQVDRLNEALSRNEWKSTDKTFIYPSGYEYPFTASNLTNNLIEMNSLWNSLRKKKSSSSSIPRYSFKKPDVEKGKMPKFHLNGKLDLSNHPLSGNVSNKSCMEVNCIPSSSSNNPTCNMPFTNDVNHTGLVSNILSSNNLPVIPSLPSSVGAPISSSFLIGSSRVCTPWSNLNPNPSTGLETVRNQLDLDPTSTLESYVPQANVYTMGESYSFLPECTMNPFETIDHMGRIPLLENYSHHETNMNRMDWNHSTENYGIHETDMTITVSDYNTNHIGCVSLGEGYVPSEHVIPFGSNTNQLGRVSLGENHVLSEDMSFYNTNTNQLGQIPSETNMITPVTDTNQMDWFLSEECRLLLETLISLETNTTQVGLVPCEGTSTALDNLIPQETNMEEVGFVPCEGNNNVPSEDLISFDTGVAEMMDVDSWLDSFDYSGSNVPWW